MKKGVLLFGAACAAAGVWAVPEATDVAVAVDAETRLATVTYALSEPAVVTVAFATNGVALSAETHAIVAGDVNRFVTNATGTILWQPRGEIFNALLAAGGLSAQVTAWRKEDPPPYLAVFLTDENRREYYASAEAVPGGVGDLRYRHDVVLMRRIPAAGATFTMGSPTYEAGHQTWEKAHVVSFTNDWYMGVFEFTQSQYVHVQNANPAKNADGADAGERPVERIGYGGHVRGFRVHGYKWPQAGHAVAGNVLMGRLRTKTGVLFDLPTEAQWEFSARAGSTTALPNGLDLTDITTSCTNADKVGWTVSNSSGQTHPVGLLAPNAWGLYDVVGNVCEQCLDSFYVVEGQEYDLTTGPEIDPPGVTTEERLAYVERGGAFMYNLSNDRLATRRAVYFYGSAGSISGVRLWCAVPEEK